MPPFLRAPPRAVTAGWRTASKEYWFIASVPGGDPLVVYMETQDFTHAFGQFVQSQDDFDQWFKQRLTEVTGVDLNNPPPDMQLPELVSSYEA